MGPGWKRQQVNTCGTIVSIVSQVFFVGGIYKMASHQPMELGKMVKYITLLVLVLQKYFKQLHLVKLVAK
jgi:hypothetical protein